MSLEFWNTVCTTDPEYTKLVKLGRTFTAIDPMYQVMKATEAMGVVTQGWGFNVQEVQYLPTDQVAVKVRVWKGDKESYIEQWGQNGLYIDKAKSMPDTDCMKKATTDGLTKCLSYFGFNADVFLGKFDDNKYVEGLKKAAPKVDNSAETEKLRIDIEGLFEMNLALGAATFKAWWGAEESKADRAKLKTLDLASYNKIADKYKAAVEVFIKQAEAVK